MEDEKIIELFWQRDETAIDETSKNMGICFFPSQKIFFLTKKMRMKV